MRSRGAVALTVLLVAAGCVGSAAKSADPPTTFYVQVRNNLPRAVYVLRCIDARCLGFEMTMRLKPKAKAPVLATIGANVYVVEINDKHRLGCLFLSYDAPPPATTVHRLSPLAKCPR